MIRCPVCGSDELIADDEEQGVALCTECGELVEFSEDEEG